MSDDEEQKLHNRFDHDHDNSFDLEYSTSEEKRKDEKTNLFVRKC